MTMPIADFAPSQAEERLPARERAMLRRALHGALNFVVGSTGRRPRRHHELYEWLVENGPALGLDPIDEPNDDNAIERRARMEAARRELSKDRGPSRTARPDALGRRLEWIASSLGLGRLDAAILGMLVRCTVQPLLQSLAAATNNSSFSNDREVHYGALAAMLGVSHAGVEERFHRHQPLMQMALIEDCRGGDFRVSETVLRFVRLRSRSPERIRAVLFGEDRAPSLGWDEFDHLGALRDLVRDVLARALRKGTKGVGILLHGAPGTGKTEFARALGAELGARVSFVGETDGADGEPSRNERISALALTGPLAAGAGDTLLVVDEADDLFAGVDVDDGRRRTGSKVFMNRVVESCPSPIVWITNHPARLGPAVMRRMAAAIEFRAPSRAVRQRIVARAAGRHRVDLGAVGIERLAALPAAPAILDAGLRAAALVGGRATRRADTAMSIAGSLLTAMGDAPPPAEPKAPHPFDPALSDADHDLVRLADRAAAAPTKALSFLLSGPPGTGKSAYARHLAERLGVETLERRASDLLSMWVGGSEKAIRDAFRDAAEAGAMLVIDEADSMLADRGGAQRSWEVSQVNEMLTWMERHPAPFAMTTNAVEALDPAALRRFTFKVRFRAMDAPRIAAMFEAMFGALAPASALRLDPLTPGDFAVVARRAAILGTRDPHALAAMLAEEVAAKPGAGSTPIGFTAGP